MLRGRAKVAPAAASVMTAPPRDEWRTPENGSSSGTLLARALLLPGPGFENDHEQPDPQRDTGRGFTLANGLGIHALGVGLPIALFASRSARVFKRPAGGK